jgi:hypothetical protein
MTDVGGTQGMNALDTLAKLEELAVTTMDNAEIAQCIMQTEESFPLKGQVFEGQGPVTCALADDLLEIHGSTIAENAIDPPEISHDIDNTGPSNG